MRRVAAGLRRRRVAPRANWKGYLKLSLVSCPIALFPAVSTSERISFHLINRATGNRLRQHYVDAETGEAVERDEQARGYGVGKGEYITLEESEIAEQAIESTHTIDIESFVPREDIDEVYFDSSYYVAPDDKVANEPFVVIREAMQKSGMVGLARVVLYGRERVLMIEPRDKGLLGTTLHYQYEIRDEKAYFDSIPDIKIPAEMLKLAEHIIETKHGTFDPSQFQDHYQEALVKLIRAKRAGKPLPAAPETKAPSNVINLMDALRRSVQGESRREPSGGNAPAARKESAKPRSASKKSGASTRGAARTRRVKKAG
jgi:DNA end-binding protein Ku